MSVFFGYRPSVLWHCWLGHMTRKTVSKMTYNVSSGTLNSTIPYHLRLCYSSTTNIEHCVWLCSILLKLSRISLTSTLTACARWHCVLTLIFWGSRMSWDNIHSTTVLRRLPLRSALRLFAASLTAHRSEIRPWNWCWLVRVSLWRCSGISAITVTFFVTRQRYVLHLCLHLHR